MKGSNVSVSHLWKAHLFVIHTLHKYIHTITYTVHALFKGLLYIYMQHVGALLPLGRITIAEVEEIVEEGELRPDEIHLPGLITLYTYVLEKSLSHTIFFYENVRTYIHTYTCFAYLTYMRIIFTSYYRFEFNYCMYVCMYVCLS
jgi:hypothetical protein